MILRNATIKYKGYENRKNMNEINKLAINYLMGKL